MTSLERDRRRVLGALFGPGRPEDLEREDPFFVLEVLLAHVAGAAAKIPPQVWEEMQERVGLSCGAPGCDCQRLTEVAWPALAALRKDYREQITTRGMS